MEAKGKKQGKMGIRLKEAKVRRLPYGQGVSNPVVFLDTGLG
jgi:hypothetical protein